MIEFDRRVLDNEYDLGTFDVTEEKLIAYAKALGETNPLFVDKEVAKQSKYGGIIATPTAYAIFRIEQKWPELNFNFGTTGFLAGESSEFYMPMRPGDKISVKTKYTDIYEKTGRSGRMIFLIRETTYTNQRGELVTKVRHSMVRR